MKYLPKLLLIIIVAYFITACSKSDVTPAKEIIGDWHQTTDTIKEYQNGALTSIVGSQLSLTSIWKFSGKGILNSYENGVINAVPSTYKVTADSLIIYVPAQNEDGLNEPAHTINWQIQTLTQHELILASTQNSFTSINLQQTIPVKAVTLYYLSR